MQVEVKIDKDCPEPRAIILTASVTEEVTRCVRMLSEELPQVISGGRDGKIEVLEQEELIRVYTSGGKVIAGTDKGEYTLRLRLYELEEKLDPARFIRISNSEIINLKKVDHFDLSFSGTICVRLSDGTVTYVSRRYLPKLKKILGMR